MPEVHRLIDFPPPPLKHKSLHNPAGLALAFILYGKDGLVSAGNHLLDDLIDEKLREYIKKGLKRKHI